MKKPKDLTDIKKIREHLNSLRRRGFLILIGMVVYVIMYAVSYFIGAPIWMIINAIIIATIVVAFTLNHIEVRYWHTKLHLQEIKNSLKELKRSKDERKD